MFLLRLFLARFIRTGRLVVIGADGTTETFGPEGERTVTIALKDRRAPWRLGLRPRLAAGELYMEGRLEVHGGTITDFLELVGRNLERRRPARHGFIGRFGLGLYQLVTQFNPAWRARRNVAHHYDLSRKLYESFLDSDMQYSCAYFAKPGLSLDEAQAAKKRHIAAKLLLERGQRVLDIGCGWGGLALDLAREHGALVDGITLSEEQLALAGERVRKAGLDNAVRFRLTDYRAVEGTYDRIVSVGMFEHVGVPHYGAFFNKVRNLLAPEGVALIHAIGSVDGPGAGNPWVRKYIFPGGYVPSLSEVLPVVESSGLAVTDIEILRLHYAETLRLWRERFLANWHRLSQVYDERFKRMWEFYLAGSEMAFRHDGLMVFQIQVSRALGAVPLTRDYIHEAERGARGARDMRTEAA